MILLELQYVNSQVFSQPHYFVLSCYCVSVLQCVMVQRQTRCSTSCYRRIQRTNWLACVSICHNAINCVIVCYNMLQCVTTCFNMLQLLHCVTFCYNMLQHVTTGITKHHCTNRLVPPMAFVENPGRQWPSASNGETKCTLCPKIQECKEIHTNPKTREYKNTLKTKRKISGWIVMSCSWDAPRPKRCQKLLSLGSYFTTGRRSVVETII